MWLAKNTLEEPSQDPGKSHEYYDGTIIIMMISRSTIMLPRVAAVCVILTNLYTVAS